MRRMWLSAGVLAIATTLFVPAQQAAQAEQAEPTGSGSAQRAPGTGGMDVWSYNITGAGTNENNPKDINNGGRPRAVRPVTNAIDAGHRPDVIALQEVCQSQFAYLAPRLDAAGYKVSWRSTKSQRRCAAYKNYAAGAPTGHGDLIAVPKSYGPTPANYDFDPRAAEVTGEGLTCLLFSKLSRTVVACSTHLSGTNDQRTAKTFRMRRDEIEPWNAQGYGVIIAGDFNTEPSQEPMKNLNHSNGIMYEADRTQNRWTHQNRKSPYARRKIDHVYFSDNWFPRSSFVSALDAKPEYSYHRFFAASASMR